MKIIDKLENEYISERGILQWPVWEKEISRFDWYYDSDEECLILEGKAEITTPAGVFTISPGNFVRFTKGLKCQWNILEPIRKHYNFPR